MAFSFTVVIFVDSLRWLTTHASGSIIARFYTAGSDPATAQLIPYGPAVIINVLWFASLILTFTSCLMCHLNLQWLQEFRNEPQFDAENQVAFRQMRYDTLCRWRFFELCDIIPLMLPLASVIWFTGLIILLWELDRHHDAYIFIVGFGILITYSTFTALHPLWCLFVARQNGLSSGLSPFRSPFSWFFFKSVRRLVKPTPKYGSTRQGIKRCKRGAPGAGYCCATPDRPTRPGLLRSMSSSQLDGSRKIAQTYCTHIMPKLSILSSLVP